MTHPVSGKEDNVFVLAMKPGVDILNSFGSTYNLINALDLMSNARENKFDNFLKYFHNEKITFDKIEAV